MERERSGADDVRATFAALDAGWSESLADLRRVGGPWTVLFSGGVDSGVLAWELRTDSGTRLATVGLEGSDDLAAAADAARSIPAAWQAVVVAPGDLERLRAEATAAFPRLPASLALGLAALLRFAPAGRLVCGQGADELFLGYAHFRGLTPTEAALRADADLDTLVTGDWPATVALASRWGRDVRAPFLHPAFVRAARSIPFGDRMPGDRPKALWRAWARHRGVPAPLADRPKRALQYGSGIHRWLRSTATR
ncbi:MAG TPA: asparagine synthase-related protein [Thermoplasmata archaeon]|nr:asparagine synthase-related protein [Thermoplasmata archaeon]